MSNETIPRRYKLPPDMANKLRQLCEDEALNESAFVRMAISNELAKRGIIVDHVVKRGGWREREKKRGIFSRS